jgi:flagellar assembly protein FliH
MAKTVFRPQETITLTSAFMLNAPKGNAAVEAVEETIPVFAFEGPTADDLRRDAELFKSQWETEKATMLAAATADAQEIMARAEAAAFNEVKSKNDQALKVRREAEASAEKAIKDAENRVREIEAQAKARIDEITRDAFKKGFDEGRESGFAEGRSEVERLVGRLHLILDRAMEKRGQILEQTEAQVIELVLLIARKVVKTISENQKNVVISNIAQALRKLKTKSDVVIKVNLVDLQLATQHAREFIEMAENARNLTVVEDSSVDRGGCIIETDFGEIDARIASQLHELEDKILDLSPIKTRGKAQ